MKEIECECGNKDQSRFYAVTPVIGYEKKGRNNVPIRKLEGWRCQDCQKVNKTGIA